nr:hypothetical protein CFP56_56503 [Quercus suber]
MEARALYLDKDNVWNGSLPRKGADPVWCRLADAAEGPHHYNVRATRICGVGQNVDWNVLLTLFRDRSPSYEELEISLWHILRIYIMKAVITAPVSAKDEHRLGQRRARYEVQWK